MPQWDTGTPVKKKKRAFSGDRKQRPRLGSLRLFTSLNFVGERVKKFWELYSGVHIRWLLRPLHFDFKYVCILYFDFSQT